MGEASCSVTPHPALTMFLVCAHGRRQWMWAQFWPCPWSCPLPQQLYVASAGDAELRRVREQAQCCAPQGAFLLGCRPLQVRTLGPPRVRWAVTPRKIPCEQTSSVPSGFAPSTASCTRTHPGVPTPLSLSSSHGQSCLRACPWYPRAPGAMPCMWGAGCWTALPCWSPHKARALCQRS